MADQNLPEPTPEEPQTPRESVLAPEVESENESVTNNPQGEAAQSAPQTADTAPNQADASMQ